MLAPEDRAPFWRHIVASLLWIGGMVGIVGLASQHMPWVTSGACFALAGVVLHGWRGGGEQTPA